MAERPDQFPTCLLFPTADHLDSRGLTKIAEKPAQFPTCLLFPTVDHLASKGLTKIADKLFQFPTCLLFPTADHLCFKEPGGLTFTSRSLVNEIPHAEGVSQQATLLP